MKTLTIFRHAKSSWDNADLSDFERPLLPKGIKRTKKSCQWMKENNIIPDLIVSSPAERAKLTAQIIQEQIGSDIKIEFETNMYPGNQDQILEILENTDINCNHLLIIGHNPGITDITNCLTGEENIEWMPTSGFATLFFDTNKWSRIRNKKAQLMHYIEPKGIQKTID
ncbi:MAG: histidine phosphatase family protein [Salinivirgaceae bacterium]|nr:histidine phosphatase family protein [Salinivirgaceae bacterium]